MITINEHYLKLQSSYLFSTIARKVREFQEKNPEKEIIKLGIGDVTQALPRACIDAFLKGVREMGDNATFRGYGPEQGYQFLREKAAEYDYKAHNADISADEIFISDGSKCDSGNIQEIFGTNIKIGIPDPVYPVYVDTNVMAGRTGKWKNGRYSGLYYLESTMDNDFIPDIPGEGLDLIYLCFPNNPTGAAISRDDLTRWVAYAQEHKAVILYDAAYVAFIRDASLPHTIYEIDGAKEVAIEFRSFSKTAGFTGTRCAYTVVPKECRAYDSTGNTHQLHSIWNRRHNTKFNGVSYPVQRAAEAVYSPEGQKQIEEINDYYLANAAHIKRRMEELGYSCTGGENSPYIWVQAKMKSWDFFDMLLDKASVVCTPGSGFGKCGEGFIRISAFNNIDKVKEAMERITGVLSSA